MENGPDALKGMKAVIAVRIGSTKGVRNAFDMQLGWDTRSKLKIDKIQGHIHIYVALLFSLRNAVNGFWGPTITWRTSGSIRERIGHASSDPSSKAELFQERTDH
jgi:hypothetical protein